MRMSSYEFSRECNVARNRELGEGLRNNIIGNKNTGNKAKRNKRTGSTGGQVTSDPLRRSRRFVDAESETAGPLQHGDKTLADTRTTPHPDSLPRRADEPGISETSRTNPDIDAPQDADESRTTPNPEQSADLSPSHAHPAELTNLSKAPATPKHGPAFTINKTAWPEWLSEKYDYYDGLKFGDDWKESLFVWTELERAFQFRNPVSYSLISLK